MTELVAPASRRLSRGGGPPPPPPPRKTAKVFGAARREGGGRTAGCRGGAPAPAPAPGKNRQVLRRRKQWRRDAATTAAGTAALQNSTLILSHRCTSNFTPARLSAFSKAHPCPRSWRQSAPSSNCPPWRCSTPTAYTAPRAFTWQKKWK